VIDKPIKEREDRFVKLIKTIRRCLAAQSKQSDFEQKRLKTFILGCTVYYLDGE
jgi:hypothetical protein